MRLGVSNTGEAAAGRMLPALMLAGESTRAWAEASSARASIDLRIGMMSPAFRSRDGTPARKFSTDFKGWKRVVMAVGSLGDVHYPAPPDRPCNLKVNSRRVNKTIPRNTSKLAFLALLEVHDLPNLPHKGRFGPFSCLLAEFPEVHDPAAKAGRRAQGARPTLDTKDSTWCCPYLRGSGCDVEAN